MKTKRDPTIHYANLEKAENHCREEYPDATYVKAFPNTFDDIIVEIRRPNVPGTLLYLYEATPYNLKKSRR